MFTEFKKQINNSLNKRKFTIPESLYTNQKYCNQRRLIILKIAEIFEKNVMFKNKKKHLQDQIIIIIEESCYNATIKKANELMIYINWDNSKFTYLYQLFCNKITKNLDVESEVQNTYLINKIINDEINLSELYDIAGWDSNLLCPDKSNTIKQNLLIRKNQKLDYKTSSMYTCKNCKKRSVTIKEFQARSCDEGSNLSLTCLFCGFGWVI